MFRYEMNSDLNVKQMFHLHSVIDITIYMQTHSIFKGFFLENLILMKYCDLEGNLNGKTKC